MSDTRPYPFTQPQTLSYAPALPYGDHGPRVAVFDPTDEPNLIIDGELGAGKTTAVIVLAAAATAQRAIAYVFTPVPAAGPDPFALRVTDLEEAEAVVRAVRREIRARVEVLEREKVEHAAALRPELRPQRLFVFVDEIDQLRWPDEKDGSDRQADQYRKYIIALLDEIAVEGGSVCVHLVITASRIEETSLTFRETAARLHLDSAGVGVVDDEAVAVWQPPAGPILP